MHKMQESTLEINRPKFLQKYFKKGGFFLNVGTMMAGNASAQIVVLLLAPVITRLYLPEHFGVMAVIVSFVNVVSAISCLRYEKAVILPVEDEQAQNLITVCLALTFMLSLVSFISVPFANDRIESYFRINGLKNFIYLVPLGVLAKGLVITFRSWFARKKNFALIAKAIVIIPLSASAIKIGAGLMIGSSALWLILGDMIGVFIAVGIFVIIFLQNNYQQFKNNLSRQEILSTARKYDKFPKYSSGSALMGALSANMPAVLFAYFFSAEFVGFYALAARILKKPVQLISKSINDVYFQKVAELQNKGKNLRSNYLKAIALLVVLGIIPFGLIAIAGEWIFSFVFGAKWAITGLYAKFLSPWLFLMFINPPALSIIMVRQMLSKLMVFNALLLLFRGIAIILGYYLSPDPWVAVALFSAVGAVANLWLILYAYKLTAHKDSTKAERSW
jgi:O-antigen/teichoic acid export membrane protein